MSKFIEGLKVWIKDVEDSWVVGKIQEHIEATDEFKINIPSRRRARTVAGNKEGSTVNMYETNDILPQQCTDLVRLVHKNEPSVVDILTKRASMGYPFTACWTPKAAPCDLIIAVNPNTNTGATSVEKIRHYRETFMDERITDEMVADDPHIFMRCMRMNQELQDAIIERRDNASVQWKPVQMIFAGTMASGKTETAKDVMAFFTYGLHPSTLPREEQRAHLNRDGKLIEEKDKKHLYNIHKHLGRNDKYFSVLESFGNAYTARNHNSSRFGRSTTIYFDDTTGQPALYGAQIEVFFLERTRLTSRNAGDRNFHIFYQLLKKMDEKGKNVLPAALRRPNWDNITYLSSDPKKSDDPMIFDYQRAGTDPRFKGSEAELRRNNADSYEGVRDWLAQLDDEANRGRSMIKEGVQHILLGILLIGQIKYGKKRDPNNPDKHVYSISDPDRELEHQIHESFELDKPSGTEFDRFFEILSINSNSDNGSAKKFTKEEDANEYRDSIARWLYVRLFKWVVNQLNEGFTKDSSEPLGGQDLINIVDPPGYDNTSNRAKNNFEQFLIHFAEEKICSEFYESTFEQEQDAYDDECVSIASIQYDKNTQLIAIAKKMFNSGLNDSATKNAFPNFVKTQWNAKQAGWQDSVTPSQQNDEFKEFTIKHTFANVTYDATKFQLRDDEIKSTNKLLVEPCKNIMVILSDSNNEWLREFFTDQTPRETDMKCMDPSRVELTEEDKRKMEKKELGAFGVAETFRRNLKQIMDLNNTDAAGNQPLAAIQFHVRCIRPNLSMQPTDINYSVVVDQLKSASVMSMLKYADAGFALRVPYKHIAEDKLLNRRYHISKDSRELIKKKALKKEKLYKVKCMDMVKQMSANAPSEIALSPVDYVEGQDGADEKGENIFLKLRTRKAIDDHIEKLKDACGLVKQDVLRVVRTQKQRRKLDMNRERMNSVKAYMKCFIIRKREQNKLARKRLIWGTIATTLRVRRFKRDRLALKTIQLCLRETRAMKLLDERSGNAAKEKAQLKLIAYNQMLQAQAHIRRKAKQLLEDKKVDVGLRVLDQYRTHNALANFWDWRSLVSPFKREAERRRKAIYKIQGFLKGALQRRGKSIENGNEDFMVQTFTGPRHGRSVMWLTGDQIKTKYQAKKLEVTENRKLEALQRLIRGQQIHRLFVSLQWAAGQVSFYLESKMKNGIFTRKQHATIAIQSAFRGWLARSLISWQKMQVLYDAEQASVNRQTMMTRRSLFNLVGVRPLSIVDMTTSMDIEPFYPDGWCKSYEDLLQRDGVVKMAMGAEHTIVVGQNAVYAWGSDEVGQLGIGNITEKQKTSASTRGLVAPFFRQKVLDIACGRWHTIAVVEGPEPVYTWGLNHRGQCGIKGYQQGAAFTPSYPKIVHTPTPVAITDEVTGIAAGPFHTAVVCDDGTESPENTLFCWGEGHACGSAYGDDCGDPKKVGKPMDVLTPKVLCTASAVVLADQCGFIISPTQQLLAWGTKTTHLGVGAYPKKTRKENTGLMCVNPLIRFDTDDVARHKKGKVVPKPIPVRLPPKTLVADVQCGEDHILCITRESLVYEWGIRQVVKTEPPTDCGLIHMATPVRVDFPENAPLQIRAVGNQSMVILEGTQEICGWNFVETTTHVDLVKPARYSFRLLKPETATRIEVAGSASIHVVYGYDSKWKEIKDPPQYQEIPIPRRGAQPKGQRPADAAILSPRKPPRTCMGNKIKDSTSPVRRMKSASPRKPVVKFDAVANLAPKQILPPKLLESPSKLMRVSANDVDTRRLDEDEANQACAMSPRSERLKYGFLTQTFVDSRKAKFPSDAESVKKPGYPTPPRLKDRTSPLRSPMSAGRPSPRAGGARTPRTGASPKKDRAGIVARPGDLIESFSSGPKDQSKFMFEIQHLLRGRSRDELETIARQLKQ